MKLRVGERLCLRGPALVSATRRWRTAKDWKGTVLETEHCGRYLGTRAIRARGYEVVRVRGKVYASLGRREDLPDLAGAPRRRR